MQKRLAFLVHVFTAAGAWAGLQACCHISNGAYREAFLYMFLAVAIDSVDGTFARFLKVEENCPHVDGRRLDDMVDYFTWVVTPTFFMVHSGVLPPIQAIWALPLMCSALGMANRQAKTEDDYFLGFPSLWNVVALYLWKFNLPSDCNAGIVVALAVAVLAPVKFIYPTKTVPFRNLSMAMMLSWIFLSASSLLWSGGGARACFLLSLIFPVYYVGLSLYLNFATKPEPLKERFGRTGTERESGPSEEIQ